jgi:hypothetical protein
VLCVAPSVASGKPIVAKIYNPLYQTLNPNEIPRDPVARADNNFCTEAAAYSDLDPRLGGRLVPKYHGSWVLRLPVRQSTSVVYAVSMKNVDDSP